VIWRHGTWRSELTLPFGISHLVREGTTVRAGDVVARGTRYRGTRKVPAARVLGCRPEDVPGLLRVDIGDEIKPGTVIARPRGRFRRGIVARDEGRLVHVSANGDIYVGTVRQQWAMHSTLDGVVVRVDGHSVVVEGAAWALDGLAAYGPGRAGTLTFSVKRADQEIRPSRVDVGVTERILVGGARVSGEALARAHAVNVAGVVVASVSFTALRAIYGEDVSAFGSAGLSEVPTLLVLGAFGTAFFPEALFAAMQPLAGSLAAIDTRAVRLYVFGPAEASSPMELARPDLEPDLSGVRAQQATG
jgi:hypothetical protein